MKTWHNGVRLCYKPCVLHVHEMISIPNLFLDNVKSAIHRLGMKHVEGACTMYIPQCDRLSSLNTLFPWSQSYMLCLLKVQCLFPFSFPTKKSLCVMASLFFSWAACISLKHSVITISIFPSAFSYSLSKLRRDHTISPVKFLPAINIPGQQQLQPFFPPNSPHLQFILAHAVCRIERGAIIQ